MSDPVQGKTRYAMTRDKGWAVYALVDFAKGEVVEQAPVVPLTLAGLAPGVVDEYRMAWTDDEDCLALGNVNLINHSTGSPNATIVDDVDARMKIVVALRDIRAGEEIRIKYNCSLWFGEKP